MRRSLAHSTLAQQIEPAYLDAPADHLHPALASWDATVGLGAYLYGPPGTGKTSSASILVRRAYRQLTRHDAHPPSIAWLPVADTLQRIIDGFQRQRYDTRPLYESDLVVLDDWGFEKVSEWSRGLLYGVINHRMTHHLLTIYTSQLSPSELAARLDAPAIASRIAGTTVQVDYTGRPDHRITT